MSSSLDHEAARLFKAAISLPPSERPALLTAECRGDAVLLARVQRLIALDDTPDAFLEPPLGRDWVEARFAGDGSAGCSPSDAGVDPLIGQRVGRFRILRTIGRGGMGVVYEAEQEHPARTVALKVMRSGIASPSALRRFQHEADVLGQLHHPGIAQIFDAGIEQVAGMPVPYFAMELVRGQPLNEYVRQRQPDVRELLERMARVCDAVQHAHQKGVIHRDLKPANILIADELPIADCRLPISAGSQSEIGNRKPLTSRTRSPVPDVKGRSAIPKVVDFGVARVTGADVAAATLTMEVGQIIGTLGYISPEQIGSDARQVDTRCDVYAIGVMLYELLAGRLPYDVRSTELAEALRKIREEVPTRLRSIQREIDSDLETIVSKALEKDPDQRYGSAAALADDLRRYLAGQPILARAPSTVYQIRKLVGRHRIGTAFVASILALIVGFGVWMTVLYRRAVAAERQAETERTEAVAARDAERDARAEAEAVSAFLNSMLRSANSAKSRNPNIRVRDLLDDAARAVGHELAGRPLVEAAVRQTIGDAYLSLGLRDAAGPQLQAALDLRRSLLGEQHLTVADTLESVGEWLRANSDYAAAQEHFARALDIRTELQGPQHMDVATLLGSQAANFRNAGDPAAAERLYLEAIGLARAVSGRPEAEAHAAQGWPLAKLLNGLGIVLREMSRHDEAESLFREALDIYRAELGDEHSQTLGCLHNIAVVMADRGEVSEAEAIVREVLDTSRRLLGNNHPDTLLALNAVAASAFNRGDYAAAETLLEEILQTARRIWGPASPEVSGYMYNLGHLRSVAGEFAAAEQIFRDALAVELARVGDQHPDVAYARTLLGRALQAQSRPQEAVVEYRQVLAVYRQTYGDAHPNVAEALADVASTETDAQVAEGLFRESVDVLWNCGPAARSSLAGPLGMLAKVLIEQERYDAAEPIMRECLALREEFARHRWVYAIGLTHLGVILARQAKFAEAEPLLLSGYEEMQKHRDAPPRSSAEPAEELVRLYEAWGRPQDADRYRAEPANAGEVGRDGTP